MSITYKVDGMSCNHCVKSVTSAIKELDASVDVQIDLDSKQVNISKDLDEGALRDAIEDVGFDFIGKA
jgi:copper chaperone